MLGTRQGPALSSCKAWGGTAQMTTQGHRGTLFSGRFQISGDHGTQLLRAIRLREDHSSRGGGPRSETTQFMSEVDRFLTGKSPKCLQLWPLVSYPRLCSDGAPQTTHDIWGNWAAGASHAGDSSSTSPGLSADKGLLGSPYSQHGTQWQSRGGPKYLKTFRA